MPSPLHTWLLCLSDPDGFHTPLPEHPLKMNTLERLMHLAQQHTVLPAVITNTQNIVIKHGIASLTSGCPAEFQSILQEAEREWRRRIAFCLVLRRQGEEILQALARQSIPAIPLKGPDFADRLYPTPSLRIFTDIDLLIPRDKIPATNSIMKMMGYRPKIAKRKHSDIYGQTAWRRDSKSEGTVEIHWNLVNSPAVRRAVSVRFEDIQLGRSIPQRPTAAALLLIAAVHAASSHAFDRLLLLYDIRQICRGAAGPVDLDYLSDIIHKTGSAMCVASALHLSDRMFEEEICRQITRQLALPVHQMKNRVISPTLVLRKQKGIDDWRRKLYRETLKRS